MFLMNRKLTLTLVRHPLGRMAGHLGWVGRGGQVGFHLRGVGCPWLELGNLALGVLRQYTTARWFRRLLALGAVLMATSVGVAIAKADATLDGFFRTYLEADLQFSPMSATQLGDHRFDHLLDDVSAAARRGRQELTRRTLEQLPQRVDYTKLSRAGQVEYEILRDSLKLNLWLEETERPDENDPRKYTGLATDCAYILLTQSTLPKEMNISNAIARMKLVPGMLAAARKNLRHPPRVRTETAIQQNAGAISFYESDIFELVGETPQLEALKVAAKEAGAALRQHQVYLERELLPQSTGDCRLGKKRFAQKLAKVLNAGVTADQVVAEAETTLAQVRRDMLLVARQLWSHYFPGQPLPPDDEPGRRETILRVIQEIGRDHGTPAELSRDARATVARLKQFITARDILKLLEPDRCQIVEMPEFQRGNSVAFLNPAPALDATAASIYAISPPPKTWDAAHTESFLSEYNRQMLQVLTIHEAYPGHYVQFYYANLNPSLLRRVEGSGVFAEGWANYCEQMMVDQGYGDGDLSLRLMQLKFYLRSVANAVLDNKMHCTAMSDEEALRFLTVEAFQSEGEARLKIIRAKLGSCQLSTYFVGRMAFMRLRQQVQREMGSEFNLGRFHEAVLEQASVPVKYLPELVRAQLKLNQPNRQNQQ